MFKNLVRQVHRELITSGGGSSNLAEEQIPDSELEQQPNPNPNNPPAPPIDADYVKRLEDSIKQNNELTARNAEIMRRMEERLNTPPTPVAPVPVARTAEEDKAAYYEDPAAFTKRAIDEALDRTVKPLNEFVTNFRSNDQVDRLINDVKRNPQLAAQWDAQVENAVRQQLSTVSGANLNAAIVQQAAINAIGLKALGVFGSPAPAPAPSNNPDPNSMQPPNVRPSNPPAPNSRSSKPAPTLTENERRLAREKGQTPEEYVWWRDLPSERVMTAKWDRKTNAEAK